MNATSSAVCMCNTDESYTVQVTSDFTDRFDWPIRLADKGYTLALPLARLIHTSDVFRQTDKLTYDLTVFPLKYIAKNARTTLRTYELTEWACKNSHILPPLEASLLLQETLNENALAAMDLRCVICIIRASGDERLIHVLNQTTFLGTRYIVLDNPDPRTVWPPRTGVALL